MGEMETPEGYTHAEIEAAYELLESVKERHSGFGHGEFVSTLSEAQYLLRSYEHEARWSEQWDVPEVGDVVHDPESNPRYGDGMVEVCEVTDKPAARTYIDVDTGKRSVAWMNRNHPEDAPVVKGRYVEGSDKVYAFPCTRLKDPNDIKSC